MRVFGVILIVLALVVEALAVLAGALGFATLVTAGLLLLIAGVVCVASAEADTRHRELMAALARIDTYQHRADLRADTPRPAA